MSNITYAECSGVCSFGSPGCGQAAGSGSPFDFYCDLDPAGLGGTGDLGYRAKVCDCNTDCGRSDAVCEPESLLSAQSGRKGVCGSTLYGSGEPRPNLPSTADPPDDALPRRVESWLESPAMSILRTSIAALGLLFVLSACEDPPKPEAAKPAASAPAPAPSAATVAPSPAPEAAKPAPPKPKKKLEDCPKGPNVQIDQKEIEAEIRKKLQKPDGALTNADLKKVRSLNLSSVKLAELDVCVFSQLTGLKDLFLGSGDFDDLSPIAGAKDLESLAASRNQVHDLSPLAKLTKLDRLDLGRTQVSDLKPIAELTSLTELALDDCPVDDISPLVKMTKLEKLSIQRTKVKDASPLKALKKLKFLYVAGTPADEEALTLAPVRANGTKVFN